MKKIITLILEIIKKWLFRKKPDKTNQKLRKKRRKIYNAMVKAIHNGKHNQSRHFRTKLQEFDREHPDLSK